MATLYGRNFRRVPINNATLSLTSMTLVSSGTDSNGGYYASAYVNIGAGGCGADPNEPTMKISIDNDILPGWKYVTFKTYGTFVSSCWWLNEDSQSTNNILSYSAASGDRIFKSTNCFELSQFAVKTFACDNSSDNAFHSAFYVGTYREWYQTRRRNDITQPAGPGIHLSCNSTGTGAVITISDMYVFN